VAPRSDKLPDSDAPASADQSQDTAC